MFANRGKQSNGKIDDSIIHLLWNRKTKKEISITTRLIEATTLGSDNS